MKHIDHNITVDGVIKRFLFFFMICPASNKKSDFFCGVCPRNVFDEYAEKNKLVDTFYYLIECEDEKIANEAFNRMSDIGFVRFTKLQGVPNTCIFLFKKTEPGDRTFIQDRLEHLEKMRKTFHIHLTHE